MDTSHDFNSQTFDFLMGEGNNFPQPSHEDYAHALFALGEELRLSSLLSDVIGHYPVRGNWQFQKGIPMLEAVGRRRSWESMRARSVLSLTEGDGEEKYGISLYLGYAGSDVVWIFIKGHASGPARGTLTECIELDVNGLAIVFARHEHWVMASANRTIGHLTLGTLNGNIEREVEGKRKKLHNLEKGLRLVGAVLERASSASVSR